VPQQLAASGTGSDAAGVFSRGVGTSMPLKMISNSTACTAVTPLRADAACATFSSDGKASV